MIGVNRPDAAGDEPFNRRSNQLVAPVPEHLEGTAVRVCDPPTLLDQQDSVRIRLDQTLEHAAVRDLQVRLIRARAGRIGRLGVWGGVRIARCVTAVRGLVQKIPASHERTMAGF
jgi:hypothetical protein